MAINAICESSLMSSALLQCRLGAALHKVIPTETRSRRAEPPRPPRPDLDSTVTAPGSSRHCTALHHTALHCTALHCTALHCTALHCTALRILALDHWHLPLRLSWREVQYSGCGAAFVCCCFCVVLLLHRAAFTWCRFCVVLLFAPTYDSCHTPLMFLEDGKKFSN
jgi:hypothetical protein